MIVEQNSFFQHVNRNFLLRKDSKTILLVAHLAVLHASSVCKEMKATAHKGKCLMQYVTSVAAIPKFLSSPAAQNQFTAVIATAAPDNIVKLKTECLGAFGFLLLAMNIVLLVLCFW